MDFNTKMNVDVRAFNEMLEEYKKVSKRSLVEILNNKAYYIAVNALNSTYKADPNKIKNELGQIVVSDVTNRRGTLVKKKSFQPAMNRRDKSLAGLIVNARRTKAGQPPLFGQKLINAMRKLYASRIRSISFLRSSWIPAIKRLSALVKKTGPVRPDSTVKKYGVDKGGCIPATVTGTTVKASIWSDIKKVSGRITQILQEGLRIAYQKETMSMAGYIKKKYEQDTAKFSK